MRAFRDLSIGHFADATAMILNIAAVLFQDPYE
jgi:hypothetical protein